MKSPADDPLEVLLEKLEAAPPSAALMARLKAAGPPELHAESRRPVAAGRRHPLLVRLFIPVAAAAAAIALAATLHEEPKPQTPGREMVSGPEKTPSVNDAKEEKIIAAALLPLRESRRKLIDVRNLGTVKDERQRPVQLLHAVWLDENTYAEPGALEGLQETSRREEIIPVLLHPN